MARDSAAISSSMADRGDAEVAPGRSNRKAMWSKPAPAATSATPATAPHAALWSTARTRRDRWMGVSSRSPPARDAVCDRPGFVGQALGELEGAQPLAIEDDAVGCVRRHLDNRRSCDGAARQVGAHGEVQAIEIRVPQERTS